MKIEEIESRIKELKALKSDTADTINNAKSGLEQAQSDLIGINHRIAELLRLREEMIKEVEHKKEPLLDPIEEKEIDNG